MNTTNAYYHVTCAARYVMFLRYRQPTEPGDAPKYVVYEPLLRELYTGGWWIADGVNTAGCNYEVNFQNGQLLSPVSVGKFQTFRPPVWISDLEPAAFVISPYPAFAGYVLGWKRLKLGESTGVGDMSFLVHYNYAPVGSARIVQLCQLHYSLPGPSFSDFRLDGLSIAYEEGEVNIGPNHHLTFSDGPSNVGPFDNQLKASFKDFLQFRPRGEDNIFVTLGLVTWGIDAVIQMDPTAAEGWSYKYPPSITPPGQDQPDLTVDEFPFWQDSYPLARP